MRHRGMNIGSRRRHHNHGMQSSRALREQEVEQILGLPGVDVARDRRNAERAALHAQLQREHEARMAAVRQHEHLLADEAAAEGQ